MRSTETIVYRDSREFTLNDTEVIPLLPPPSPPAPLGAIFFSFAGGSRRVHFHYIRDSLVPSTAARLKGYRFSRRHSSWRIDPASGRAKPS